MTIFTPARPIRKTRPPDSAESQHPVRYSRRRGLSRSQPADTAANQVCRRRRCIIFSTPSRFFGTALETTEHSRARETRLWGAAPALAYLLGVPSLTQRL